MNSQTKQLEPVSSIQVLCDRMMRERRYGALALLTVARIGGDSGTLREARAWLLFEAALGGEQRVLDVVNGLREQV